LLIILDHERGVLYPQVPRLPRATLDLRLAHPL